MNKKWDLKKVRELFKTRECILLSNTYINTKQRLEYVATCGHEHSITLDNFKAGKGDLCKDCRYLLIGDKQKLKYADVEQMFKDNGCRLLSTEYEYAHKKLAYIAQCGHKNKVAFDKFKYGIGRVCTKCSKSIRYEYDYVYETFLNEECRLLETEYKNCKTPMKYITQCGHESYITFDEFQNSKTTPKKCRECLEIKKYTINDIRQMLSENGCKLISETYITDTPISYIAICGQKKKIKFQKFMAGQGRYCNKCARPKGENHHNYNSSLTDEERIESRDLFEVIKWRRDVFARDDYRCQKCYDDKGGNLNAHHINGYNIDVENRFNINNGITLCGKCHNDFHKQYGFGNNTESQFKQWFDANTEVSNQITKG